MAEVLDIRKEKAVVPKLRFDGFTGKWQERKFKHITKKVGSGKTPLGGEKVYKDHGIPFIRSQNVNRNQLLMDDLVFIDQATNEEMNGSQIKPLDILLNITGGSIGRSCVVPDTFENGNLNQHVCIIRLKDSDPYFVQPFLSSWKGQKLIYQSQTGSGREGLNFESIKGFEIHLPNKEEQEKIASFLSAVDNRIKLLEQKKTKLEEYKKGVMQKIFNREIRFKDENGIHFPNWKKTKLKEVLLEHKIKNEEDEYDEVFSVSKSKGVVNQIHHLGRSYAAKSISHYKVVFPFDLVYTKSPTSDFPYGIIKQNRTGRTGVASTLYAVLRPLNEHLGYILHSYFHSWIKTYNYLNPLVQKGAKNTMNINNKSFLDGKAIYLPTSEKEQELISKFLESIEQKILVLDKQIQVSNQFKTGLLQQMFV